MLSDSSTESLKEDNPFTKKYNKFYWERKDLINTLPEHYKQNLSSFKKRKKLDYYMFRKIPM